jgi:1-acyl-sn-glycerol-3-phosphate acyltransferase
MPSLAYQVVTPTIRAILRLICRIDDRQLARVPDRGPLILVVNHITSIEVPILYTHLTPRSMTALAKAETWEHPLLGRLATLWDAIPLHRGEADTTAFRQAIRALKAGDLVAIAPEGTRSGDGCLQRGLPGAAMLAQLSGAPLMPVAHHGGEAFASNLRKLRRTDFHIAVGESFELVSADRRGPRPDRQAIADEIMVRIAALLPPAYRGVYADQLDAPFQFTRTRQHSD